MFASAVIEIFSVQAGSGGAALALYGFLID